MMPAPLSAVALVTLALVPPVPVPLATDALAFGEPVAIEVRDLAEGPAREAMAAALVEIREIERLTSAAADGGLAALNAAAGGGPQSADPRLVELLDRALSFCRWSQGAHGPLGGRLYRLWGLRAPALRRPADADLAEATAAAACDRLAVDPAGARVELAAGSLLDLWGFAEGFAVDRAVAVLVAHGATDLHVEIGGVERALGDGPAGGWRADLPAVPGLESQLAGVPLIGRALAVAAADRPRLAIAGDRFTPWVDQRTGRPAEGVWTSAAATELAVDAQALAAAAFILGNREGSLRLGTLRPMPAVLWLLGQGQGRPVISTFRWSALRQ